MNEFVERNPDVYYARAATTIVAGPAEIAFLKAHAAASPRHRSRLCTHPDSGALLHEMLIVHDRSVYVRPHAHRTRPESFLVIEGDVDAVLFDAAGAVRSVLTLGPPAAGLPFYYRIPAGTYHMLLIRSEWVVFHETTLGPFDPAGTDFPAWAPDGNDPGLREAFVARVEDDVRALAGDTAPH